MRENEHQRELMAIDDHVLAVRAIIDPKHPLHIHTPLSKKQ